MEFQYSDVIDPSTYETQGLCEGIPLRRHKDLMKENEGAIRAQEDWAKFVGPVGHYKGGLGAEFTFIRVTVPECLPERLEILSYANEFAFLYDDIMENTDLDQSGGDYRQLIDVFRDGAQKEGIESNSNGKKRIKAQIFTEMVDIDEERASTTMRSWTTFVQLAASRERTLPFSSLEEYLPYRIIDAGEMIWFGTVTFGMALTIPEGEMDLCKQLVRPAFVALSLTNDLFSWEKEREAAKRDGLTHVFNAIWVLMEELSITESEAKDLCRAKIKESVFESLCNLEYTKSNLGLSLDLRTYVEAIQYSVGGNLVWSLYCPRYHPEASYNDVQLAMMEQGASKALDVCHKDGSTIQCGNGIELQL